MAVLSAKEILAADDMRIEELKIPEWKGSVFLRTLAGWERDKFESTALADKLDNVRARFAVLICCDAQGERIFRTGEMHAALGRKFAAPLDRIWVAGRTLNRMDTESIEEAEKNSGSGQSADSGSSSQPG